MYTDFAEVYDTLMSDVNYSGWADFYIAMMRAYGLRDGSRTAGIEGCWEIDREVRIPSGFTLRLSGCHLRMADGCYSNMFVNSGCGTPEGRTPEGADRNISILGDGHAVLDGGEYNGLSERNHLSGGLPPVWKNSLLLFANVDGFRVTCAGGR